MGVDDHAIDETESIGMLDRPLLQAGAIPMEDHRVSGSGGACAGAGDMQLAGFESLSDPVDETGMHQGVDQLDLVSSAEKDHIGRFQFPKVRLAVGFMGRTNVQAGNVVDAQVTEGIGEIAANVPRIG
jgi:hypothetical protein